LHGADNQALDSDPPVVSFLKSVLIGGGSVNSIVLSHGIDNVHRQISNRLAHQAGDAVTKNGENPVPAGIVMIYLVKGTGQDVIDAAKIEFGNDCVVMFPDVE